MSSLNNKPISINVFKPSTSAKMLSETDVRYAIKHTNTNTEAADFLNTTLLTFKKYAEQYFDHESGESLYQANRKDPRKLKERWTREDWIKYYKQKFKKDRKQSTKKDMLLILKGELSYSDHIAFRKRLLKEGYKDKCDNCGFSTKRMTDNKIPLVLKYIDGNKDNKKWENLEALCLNCNFLYYGSSRDGSREKLSKFYQAALEDKTELEIETDSFLEDNRLNSSSGSGIIVDKELEEIDWNE